MLPTNRPIVCLPLLLPSIFRKIEYRSRGTTLRPVEGMLPGSAHHSLHALEHMIPESSSSSQEFNLMGWTCRRETEAASQFFLFGRPVHFTEKAKAAHSSTLAWDTPWTEEPGGMRR